MVPIKQLLHGSLWQSKVIFDVGYLRTVLTETVGLKAVWEREEIPFVIFVISPLS